MTNPPLNSPQKQNQQVQKIVHQQLEYSGPIPPPIILEQYEKIIPGAAERILKMAEQQASHRQSLEKRVIAHDTQNATLGILCALLITVGFLVLAGFAIYSGQSLAASIISAISITGLVGTFIYGTRSRKQEREHRFKESSSH